MTRQQTIDAIKALGLRCTFIRETGEFRVAYNLGPLPGGRGAQARQREQEEAGAYYTDDKEDALGTARSMANLATLGGGRV
jgi:hypothetical protein